MPFAGSSPRLPLPYLPIYLSVSFPSGIVGKKIYIVYIFGSAVEERDLAKEIKSVIWELQVGGERVNYPSERARSEARARARDRAWEGNSRERKGKNRTEMPAAGWLVSSFRYLPSTRYGHE